MNIYYMIFMQHSQDNSQTTDEGITAVKIKENIEPQNKEYRIIKGKHFTIQHALFDIRRTAFQRITKRHFAL